MRHPRVIAAAVVAVGAGLAAFALAAPALADSHHASGHRYLVSGVVSSLGSGDFVITEHDGKTVTIYTTSSTTYFEPGDPTQPTGVAVGEHVVVRLVHYPPTGTSNQAGSGSSPSVSSSVTPGPVARSVYIELSSVRGQVSSLIAGGFVVSDDGGAVTHDVFTSLQTKYLEAGESPTGVAVGEEVEAWGNTETGGLDALLVRIFPPPPPSTSSAPSTAALAGAPFVGFVPPVTTSSALSARTAAISATGALHKVTGMVDSVTSATDGTGDIVLTEGDGSSFTVAVDSSTVYYVWKYYAWSAGNTPGSGSLSDVQPGDLLVAYGTTTDGTFTASYVLVAPPPSRQFPAPGPGPQPQPQPQTQTATHSQPPSGTGFAGPQGTSGGNPPGAGADPGQPTKGPTGGPGRTGAPSQPASSNPSGGGGWGDPQGQQGQGQQGQGQQGQGQQGQGQQQGQPGGQGQGQGQVQAPGGSRGGAGSGRGGR